MSSDLTAASQPVNRAVIPAAGLGTRLRPLTQAFPKELLPLGREPVLAHIVAELRAVGITEALFVVSERKPQIRAYFGDRYGEDSSLPPLRCDYVLQPEPRGSGDAVLRARDWAGTHPFVVAFGDCLIDSQPSGQPLRRLIELFSLKRAQAAVLVEAVARERVSRYGVVAPQEPRDAEGMAPFALSGIVEKPRVEEAPSRLVVAARWVLDASIFPALAHARPDPRGEISIPDAVRETIREGARVWAAPLQPGEARRDIGSLESYLAEFVRVALRDPDYGASARKVAEAAMHNDLRP
jgi:UTP--glucose-1-phosphate uridylyltransferase